MKPLYKRVEYLSYWFRYEATYLEMKYHLKQVIKGRETSYFKRIGHYDRNIGKSAALARLSAKYDIPVIVPLRRWADTIEKDIPRYLPQYFKKRTPKCICVNECARQKRYDIMLIEENVDRRYLPMSEAFIGYEYL